MTFSFFVSFHFLYYNENLSSFPKTGVVHFMPTCNVAFDLEGGFSVYSAYTCTPGFFSGMGTWGESSLLTTRPTFFLNCIGNVVAN